MSQWGAFGQAKAGRAYKQILGTYFPGTALGAPAGTVPEKVRVLVGDGIASVAVTSTAPIVAVDGAGKRYRLGAGRDGRPHARAAGRQGGRGEGRAARPLTLQPTGGANLASGGKTFRGTFEVSRSGARLQLVNRVSLEAYLLGVVPGEMPKEWPLEALKAQAVAARTYAVRALVEGRAFDLYSDWRSQVYYGVGSEAPAATRAVRETRGQILTYEGKPAQVFYFSSSGGRTLSALDVFGDGRSVPRRGRRPVGRGVAEPPVGEPAAERRPGREAVRPHGRRRRRVPRTRHAGQARGAPPHDGGRRRRARRA